MLTVKKIVTALVAVGSSSVLFAGTMGPICTPGHVTVPCSQSGWDIGARALYLSPSYAGLGYDGRIQSGSGSATQSQYVNSNYRWGFGFMVEGSYHFSTGNDLNLNWYHWDKTTSHNEPSSTLSNNHVDFYGTISARLKPRWDAVNLEFGKHVNLDDTTFVRLHGGAQYTRIVTQRTITSTGSLGVGHIPTNIPAYSNVIMTFNGFGPRVGADLAYDCYKSLTIYAKGAATLLVGPQGFHSTYSAAAVYGDGNQISGSFTGIVPELESKLGASYSYTLPQGNLSVDLGWMWLTYISAQNLDNSYGVTHETSFGVQGPYAGLKWVGNFA